MGENTLVIEKEVSKRKYFPSEPVSHAVESPSVDNIRPMYKVHKYWARKPWYVVNRYIQHFTKEDEVVLDPFCGSGVAGIEAMAKSSDLISHFEVHNEITSGKDEIADWGKSHRKIFKDVDGCQLTEIKNVEAKYDADAWAKEINKTLPGLP